MARVEIPVVVQDAQGNALAGATVDVRVRASNAQAAVWSLETGGVTLPLPLAADSFGNVAGWVDQGAYLLVVSAPGLATQNVPFDAVPGLHAAAHQAGGVDALPADATAAVAALRTLGAGALQAAAGTDGRLSNARAPTGNAGGALAGTYPNPSLAAPEAWHALPFASGWSSYGGGFEAVAYRLDQLGNVVLRGLTNGPANPPNGTTIGTLPTGYWPALTHRDEAICGIGQAIMIDITSAGAITLPVGAGSPLIALNLSFALN